MHQALIIFFNLLRYRIKKPEELDLHSYFRKSCDSQKCLFSSSNLCRLFLQSSLLVLRVHQFLFGQQQLFIQGVCLLLNLAKTHILYLMVCKYSLCCTSLPLPLSVSVCLIHVHKIHKSTLLDLRCQGLCAGLSCCWQAHVPGHHFPAPNACWPLADDGFPSGWRQGETEPKWQKWQGGKQEERTGRQTRIARQKRRDTMEGY